MKEPKFTSTSKDIKIERYPERTGVVYIRVSHPDQVENFSIPTQIKDCRAYLKREKIKEVGMFVEEGQSAKSSDRTQLQNLLHFVTKNKHKVDYVLVYKIDRWARNQMDFYALKAVLTRNGCNLISLMEQIDDSPTGKFLEGMFSGLAQLDNELKGQRTKACMITKALDGWYPVKAPYGYANNKQSKTLVRNDYYFDPIKKILLDFCEGKSISELVDYLESICIQTMGSNNRSPRSFKIKDVWSILTKSMFYAGYYDWGEHKEIKGNHEPMITWKQHLFIQNRLYNKKHEPIIITEDIEEEKVFYLNFSVRDGLGFLRCDGCNERLNSCYSKGKTGQKYPYYFCRNPKCLCKKKSMLKQDFELMFSNVLKNLKPKEETIEYLKIRVMKEWEEQYEAYNDIKKTKDMQIEKLNEEKRKTIEMRRNKELDFEDYESEMIRIKYALIALETGKNDAILDRNKLEVMLEQAHAFLSNLETVYNGFSWSNKQRLLSMVFPEGVFYKDGQFRTPQKSYLFEILEQIEDAKNSNSLMVTLRSEMSNTLFEAIKSFLQLFSEINLSLRNTQFALNF